MIESPIILFILKVLMYVLIAIGIPPMLYGIYVFTIAPIVYARDASGKRDAVVYYIFLVVFVILMTDNPISYVVGNILAFVWNVLSNIFMLGLTIALLFLIVYLVCKAFYLMYKKIQNNLLTK